MDDVAGSPHGDQGVRRVEHRGHRVWSRSVGAGTGVPLLLVHGGPGMPHDYLVAFEAFAGTRPVVVYDQYGCGLSDRAEDPAEYDVELFVEELGRIREDLGLDRVHLLAHSYGGALALEYVLRHPGSGVVSLTLSNSFASIPALVAGWQQRLDELGPHGDVLRAGDATSSAYFTALGEFVQRFVLPGEPPAPLAAAQAGMGAEVYAAMHGSSWFSPDGHWAGWDATPRLADVDVPVLALCGEHDQCVPALSRAIADGVPDGRLEILPAAHLPMLEVPELYLARVADFLAGVEAASG